MGLITHLPSTPDDKSGWPWNEESLILSSVRDDTVWPKISIITPSFNQGQFIEETIRSVLLQNYPNLEFIVIDGGSTDNSVEIIKKYEPYIKYWVSEKDDGQSHAINKGLKMCTGDIITWLNSDDLLKKDSLSYIFDKFSLDKPSWVVGSSHIVDKNRRFIASRYPPNIINEDFFLCWVENWFSQPSTFWNRNLFKLVGYLDESLTYVMDVDLWYRMTKHVEPLFVGKVLSEYRMHNETKTVFSGEESNLELILWTYNNFILKTQSPYSNFEAIVHKLINHQLKIIKIKNHLVLGNLLKFWGKYINSNFKDI